MSSVSAAYSGRRTLTATSTPSGWRACQTVPMPPCPMGRVRINGPSRIGPDGCSRTSGGEPTANHPPAARASPPRPPICFLPPLPRPDPRRPPDARRTAGARRRDPSVTPRCPGGSDVVVARCLRLGSRRRRAPDPHLRDPPPSPWSDPDRWLCRPDLDVDGCSGDLDITAVAADGSLQIVPHVRAADPRADCFYVYPTTSLDPEPQADLDPGPEEAFVVEIQAARYTSACRVFAPLYRQVSVNGLFTQSGDFDLAYDDVREAFEHFLDRAGPDRPFLLIGHSQGSSHLQRLLAEEIAPVPDRYDRLVAAHLIGGFVTRPADASTSDGTPLCGAPTDTGCIVHYNAFRAEEPPEAGAFFARTESADEIVACTNPAALDGTAPVPLGTVLPTSVPPEVAAQIGAQPGPFADPDAAPPIDTPFFSVPGLVRGACVVDDGASYLSITIDADPGDPRADDIGGDFLPGWGLHLVDVSLAALDLTALAAVQIDAM